MRRDPLLDEDELTPPLSGAARHELAASAGMGDGDELGTIREGMVASMIVFGADPPRDIGAVRDVHMVVTDGRMHTLEELQRRPGD